eukprot:11470449-Ditylum_brightwellii.AAC.1
MRHGIKVDLTPQNLGDVGKMYIEEEYMSFEFDNEKLFVKIEKPNKGGMGELEIYESKSPMPDVAFNIGTARRKRSLGLHLTYQWTIGEKDLQCYQIK